MYLVNYGDDGAFFFIEQIVAVRSQLMDALSIAQEGVPFCQLLVLMGLEVCPGDFIYLEGEEVDLLRLLSLVHPQPFKLSGELFYGTKSALQPFAGRIIVAKVIKVVYVVLPVKELLVGVLTMNGDQIFAEIFQVF